MSRTFLAIIAGALCTLLGYLGLPSAFGWLATTLLAAAERFLHTTERPVLVQIAVIVLAVAANVALWTAVALAVTRGAIAARSAARGAQTHRPSPRE